MQIVGYGSVHVGVAGVWCGAVYRGATGHLLWLLREI